MPALPNRELSRAVLIGASRFQHLPDLPAVRNNLADLRAALTDPEHGIIAPKNCLVVEEPKSPHHFMTGLRQAIRTTDDFLLVYYAGHGLRDDAGDKLYLTLRQTDREELDGSAVPFDFVKRAMEDSRARASLLVLDCCYSGMAVGIMSDGVVSQWEIEIRGSAVLASSPKNKTSHSPKGHKHTAFTGKMIHLLENGSPLENEPLTVNTLYKRVSVALTKDKLPEPKFASTETSGDLLVRKPTEPRPRPEQAPHPAGQRPPLTGRVPPQADPQAPWVPLAAREVPKAGQPPASKPSQVAPHPVPEAIEPPLRPEPPAAPNQPTPQRGEHPTEPPATWARLIGLRALWTLTSVFLALGLGGLVGVLTGAERPDGTQGDDATIMWVGFIAAVVFGVPLWLKRGRWLALRRELAPPLVVRSRTMRVVVIVGFVLCVLMFVVSLAAGPSARVYTSSDAVYKTFYVLTAGAGAVLCGYLLVTWWRSRRTGAGADHPEAPDSRP